QIIKPESSEVEANIAAFVAFIKQAVPVVNEIQISISIYSNLPEPESRHFGDTLTRLLHLAPRAEYNCGMGFILAGIRPSDVYNITRIRCRIDTDVQMQHMQLAQFSSRTLESLRIWTSIHVDISGLIADANGGYVTYFYPFADDTLFRGNSATLEYLTVDLGEYLLGILDRHQVFTRTSHPKLKYVSIWGGGFDDTEQGFQHSVDYLSEALSIAHSAPAIEIIGLPSGPDFHPLIARFASFAHIRMLFFLDLPLGFLDAVALITRLPCLSDLHSGIFHYCPLPEKVPAEDLPRWVTSEYALAGKRFKCWTLVNSKETRHHDKEAFEGMALCLLLMKLVCPNYYYSYVSLNDYDCLIEPLDLVIRRPEYQVYREQLEPLLHHKVD
ncbi:hypothetical protein EV174_003234, partial [Coemansia sp. RSA 2320]